MRNQATLPSHHHHHHRRRVRSILFQMGNPKHDESLRWSGRTIKTIVCVFFFRYFAPARTLVNRRHAFLRIPPTRTHPSAIRFAYGQPFHRWLLLLPLTSLLRYMAFRRASGFVCALGAQQQTLANKMRCPIAVLV